ncbi:aminodeoxychorismate/anthranilate synthase component II [Spirochaetia bacterium]|nr:aminodeoxychorismate/anthranilate synthase component II [Spirochaetia bacterium]GHV74940.1 aminodeoxychorismate/anthranilate synthase component II [Spirochaetia bacterium]
MGTGMILIDNYDSFTYNIVQYFEEMGIAPRVFENDRVTIDELRAMDFSHIVLSPGAGNPDGAGICLELIGEFYTEKKILGICLGHQCIAQFFGAEVVKAAEPMHGKVSEIFFDEGEPLFAGIPQGFPATRYHSLTVEPNTIRGDLLPIARTKDGVNMALKHRNCRVYGVQFHPEAILTGYGRRLLGNFI